MNHVRRVGLLLMVVLVLAAAASPKGDGAAKQPPSVWSKDPVRHEASRVRAGGRSPPLGCRSSPVKLEAA